MNLAQFNTLANAMSEYDRLKVSSQFYIELIEDYSSEETRIFFQCIFDCICNKMFLLDNFIQKNKI